MPNTQRLRSPAQSSDDSPPLPSTGLPFRPRQIDNDSFRCLTGEIEEPSIYLPHLSQRVLSLVEWCDRMLSPDEQRVANPGEMKGARNGNLKMMKSVWAERLAREKSASQAKGSRKAPKSSSNSESSEDRGGSTERRIFTELTRAVESMISAEAASRNQVQSENDTLGLPSTSRESAITVVRGGTSNSNSNSNSNSDSSSVSALVQKLEDFLFSTELVIARANDIQADNELERDAIVKFRHLLVNMDRQVVDRCREEGFAGAGNWENNSEASPGSSGSSDPGFVPGGVEYKDKGKGNEVETKDKPSEDSRVVLERRARKKAYMLAKMVFKIANTPKPKEDSPSGEKFKLDPEAATFKPSCHPITEDMLANPDRYHTCGCDKKTVAYCEYCEGDEVFCNPYK